MKFLFFQTTECILIPDRIFSAARRKTFRSLTYRNLRSCLGETGIKKLSHQDIDTYSKNDYLCTDYSYLGPTRGAEKHPPKGY